MLPHLVPALHPSWHNNGEQAKMQKTRMKL